MELVSEDYARKNSGINVKQFKPGADMTSDIFGRIEESVRQGRGDSLKFIDSLTRIGACTHFHLHDGHPLSTFSPYGVCDHLPFFWEIPTYLPGIGNAGGIYGVSGLRQVLQIALKNLQSDMVSFTLEIHPQKGLKELNESEKRFFVNWTDLTNAKAMNFWMDLVVQNAVIFKSICTDIASGGI